MPFYIKKDNSWERLKGPTDIRNNEGKVIVSVYPPSKLEDEGDRDIFERQQEPPDPEKMVVHVPKDVAVVITEEGGGKIFPGQQAKVNRRDIFIEQLPTGNITAVIHSEEPIKG